ncbi:FecR domain-containing protein [Accumulibacter sp.]|uniref:FecR domain-containing protein n=1 Tax=Accumulibacter sp. TaxID=2053492 RepID=UPI001AD5EB33|nr:FecR domain-containing protein [Accumulibacter sp.]MBN8453196.1 FecR domain-containing protein [Accumulibacter sp.]
MKALGWRQLFPGLLAALSLFVGSAVAAESRDQAPLWRYTVRPGDTLINIGARYLVDPRQWPAVQQANQVADPYRLLPGTVLRIPAAMLRRSPAVATIETSSGQVRWRAAAGREWQEAATGQVLPAGSSVETLADSSALLRLADGSRILLSASSQFVLDALGTYAGGLMVDSRLRLQSGQGEIRANPARAPNRNLRIQTPSAQVVVRGTHFRVGVDGETTREETLGGVVGVNSGRGSVRVAPGRGTIVRPGEAPLPPVRLLPAPVVAGLPARFEHLPLRFPLPRLAGAQAWLGEIASDASFDSLLLSRSGSGPALSFADLPNGTYLLRLRAIDARGLQGLDSLHRFDVFARPFPPVLNRPGDGATIRGARPTFSWTEVLGSARYRVQVAAQADFTTLLHDAGSERGSWETPADLPVGSLYWRAASIDASGQQGPWSAAVAFTYTPGLVEVDVGRAAVELQPESLRLNLPPPPDGLAYEAILSAAADLGSPLAEAQSDDGRLDLPRPDAGTWYLGVRLVDRRENMPGPLAIRKLEVPPGRLWLLLLLLPLLAL